MTDVVERSSKTFTVQVYVGRTATAPGTARYKLYSLTSKKTVLDWQTISSPGSSITITIPSSLNLILKGESYEDYELILQTDYDNPTIKQTQTKRYRVVDVEGVDN